MVGNGTESKLKTFLRENAGYGLDYKIPAELFDECKEDLHETNRSLVNTLHPEACTYRDNTQIKSLHITDYRGIERDKHASNVILGHLEFFNPEKHFFLHSLIDFPIWFIKNNLTKNNNL